MADERKMTAREWEIVRWAKRRGIPTEDGKIKHPTEDRYLTYREYKQLRREDRLAQLKHAWEVVAEPAVLTIDFVKKPIVWLIPPHYLKHPTEDGEVTYRDWKKAQKAVIRREKNLLFAMRAEHNLFMRGLRVLSHTGDNVNAALLYPFRKGIQFARNARLPKRR